ncbi:MAG: PAS domain S-box protein [Thermodesulfobacteriota bacterium]
MHRLVLEERIKELENQLELYERKADILTSLLKEANAEFEAALERVTSSERNFRAVFENAPEAIFIMDADTRQVLDYNPFFLDWLGYRPAELRSMRVDDLIAEGGQDLQGNIHKALKEGLVRVQERRYLRRDGSAVDAEVTGTLVEYEGKRCVAVLIRDVTERKELEELSRYKELFETVVDPVFINDFHGRFLEINEGACRFSEYSREELLRMSVKDLAGPAQKQRLTDTLNRLHSEDSLRFELEMTTRSGKRIPFEMHSRAITYMGEPAVLSVARDLSVRKGLEEKLIWTERLVAVGQMASGVAHNFNNLLQMIMGAAQAASGKLDHGNIDQCREAIDTILGSCERGADIVRRIKDFTHRASDEVRDTKTFALRALVEEAVELARPLWTGPTRSPRYEFRVNNPEGIYVRGKPSQIYEVLVNLMRNAIEAMPGGGVLAISTSRADGRVFLRVEDTGEGIPKQNLQRIFEPFFTTKGLKSSGLGLSSSYGIIKKHQGEIQAESTVGRGTAFTVVLPEAAPEAETVREPAESAVGPEINLLVIDDERNIVKAMEMFFDGTEIRITGATSGAKGIEAYRQGGFDVVLCDLGMDEVNGWDVAKTVKELCERKGACKTPLIAYTGWDDGIDSHQLEAYGVDRVITKPVRMENLRLIIRELVAKGSACRQERP